MASRANVQAELDLVRVLSTSAPATVAKGWTRRWVFTFLLFLLPLCTSPASLIQGGSQGDVLLPPAGAIGRVELVMAAARQDAAFLGYTASAKGFRKGSKAFLKRYFKCISGLNAPDNPVSWGFQHILLGLTHFPFQFCRSPQNQLDSLEEQII